MQTETRIIEEATAREALCLYKGGVNTMINDDIASQSSGECREARGISRNKILSLILKRKKGNSGISLFLVSKARNMLNDVCDNRFIRRPDTEYADDGNQALSLGLWRWKIYALVGPQAEAHNHPASIEGRERKAAHITSSSRR